MRETTDSVPMAAAHEEPIDDDLQVFEPLVDNWKILVAGPIVVGLLAFGVTYLIPESFTSRTLFVAPQQQQSAASAAIAQLGALSGLAGAAAGIKSPADQYIALLQSASVSDRLLDAFKLMTVYDLKYRFEARERLADNVRISLGKRDGLISIEVEDHDRQRAADIANRYVDELRRLTSELALTESQQRRVFFEGQLQKARERLTRAQQELQASGFNQLALKADARAAAEGYARLRAEVTSGEMRLQALRRNLADLTPEVQQAMSALDVLRSQLAKLEASSNLSGGPDYVSKFRDFKYQEALFELFARQYELARLDESREGALIQVIDVAQPAERKSKPRRAIVTAMTMLASAIAIGIGLVAHDGWRRRRRSVLSASSMARTG